MRILQKVKDGGLESTVDAYFLIEIKWLFSIALLKFNKGTRSNYHSHAFNAYTWFLKGSMFEQFIDADSKKYRYSIIPKYTPRNLMHRVMAYETSWCFTIRGPWTVTWKEFDPVLKWHITLTNGRKIVSI